VRQASALVCEGARATSKKRQKEDIRQRHRTDINGQGSSQQSKTVVQYTVVKYSSPFNMSCVAFTGFLLKPEKRRKLK